MKVMGLLVIGAEDNAASEPLKLQSAGGGHDAGRQSTSVAIECRQVSLCRRNRSRTAAEELKQTNGTSPFRRFRG
jgi:hypothetical protein